MSTFVCLLGIPPSNPVPKQYTLAIPTGGGCKAFYELLVMLRENSLHRRKEIEMEVLRLII